MLSVNLVMMLLLFSIYTYAVCVILMLIFGIDKFSSENNNSLEVMKIVSSTTNVVGKENFDGNVSALMDNNKVSNVSIQTLCVINILLCHITILMSLCTILFITLYECIQDVKSIQCILTWGNHAASRGIGIAVVLIMLSILIPLLNLYKTHSSSSHLFDKYIGTYLTFYVFFAHVILETKLMDYRSKCLSSAYIMGNVSWFYAGLCVHLLYHFVVVIIMNVYAPHSTVVVYSEILAEQYEKWNVFMGTMNLLCNTAVLMFFIAYGYNTSTPFNFIQTTLLSIYIIATSYRIIFVKSKLTVKRHTS